MYPVTVEYVYCVYPVHVRCEGNRPTVVGLEVRGQTTCTHRINVIVLPESNTIINSRLWRVVSAFRTAPTHVLGDKLLGN